MGSIPITRSILQTRHRPGYVHPLNIAVVGRSPAGLAAALALSRTTHHVTLLEQFDHSRSVGSGIGLQPTGLAVPAKLGLASRIECLGRPIVRLFGVSLPSHRRVLDVDYGALGPGHHGLAVHRAALFHVLFDAVSEVRVPI